MNKKLKILFFCMIFAEGAIFAQQRLPAPARFNVAAITASLYQPRFHHSFQSPYQPTYSIKPGGYINGDFYAKSLPFICRKEIQLDKITPVAFRFRLGSVEQCNWLEGKNR